MRRREWECKRNISTLMASGGSCVPCNMNSHGVYSCSIAIIKRARQNATVCKSKRATDLVTSLAFLSAVFFFFPRFALVFLHALTHAHRWIRMNRRKREKKTQKESQNVVRITSARSIKINTNINPRMGAHELPCVLCIWLDRLTQHVKSFPFTTVTVRLWERAKEEWQTNWKSAKLADMIELIISMFQVL